MVDSSYLFFLSLSFSRGATTKAKFFSQRKFQLVKMISALVNEFHPQLKLFMMAINLFLSVFLGKGTPSAITVNITCDRNLYLYVDGKYLGGDVADAKKKHYFTNEIMPHSHVVAIRCTASTPPWQGGILGSFENGLVTDTSWRCTTSAEYGWNMRSYRDDDWPMATSHGANSPSTLPWGNIDSIDKKAAWIWSSDNKDDSEVFCRHKLVKECTEGLLLF